MQISDDLMFELTGLAGEEEERVYAVKCYAVWFAIVGRA